MLTVDWRVGAKGWGASENPEGPGRITRVGGHGVSKCGDSAGRPSVPGVRKDRSGMVTYLGQVVDL